MDLINQVQILNKSVWISASSQLPYSYELIVVQTGLFSLDMATNLKGQQNSKQLFCTYLTVHGGGKYIHSMSKP